MAQFRVPKNSTVRKSKEMGAPKRWIKTLLGLKKDKLVSPEEENSTGSTGRIWQQRKKQSDIYKGIFDIESNQNVEPEFKRANLQSVLDPVSSPSTSLEVQNAAERQWSMREERMAVEAKEAKVQSHSDPFATPFTSFQVQSAGQLNMREEWEALDDRDDIFQSVPTSPPSTSLKVQNAAQSQKGLGDESVAIATEDVNLLSVPDPTSPPSTSLKVQQAAHLQLNMREEWAAVRIQTAFREFLLPTSIQLQNGAQPQQDMSEDSAAIRIQTAFRGFRARRALHALKGLVRLQALVRGHAVRRQAAITLRCMQALVKVQARTRARHARMALENQTAQQKLKEQLEDKKIEDGWCDSTGSADEIQAKLQKRKEAAAKREKAKAYALARQWQASSKQQATPIGFEPDKSNWGWNWLERWMAVRPWENRVSDTNFNEGMKILENESFDAKNAPKSTGKKPIPNTGKGKSVPRLRNSIEKRDTTLSDGCSPSPRKSTDAQTTPIPSRMSCKPVVKDLTKEATSSPSFGLRSASNPKERSTLLDKQGNKRLSLPGVAPGAPRARRLSGTGVKSSPTAPKPVTARNKPNGVNVKTTKLSRQVSQ